MHWEISRCFGFIRIFVSMDNGEIIIYRTADGETRLEVRMESDSVWLTQAQMAELFQRDISVISRHIKNVFQDWKRRQLVRDPYKFAKRVRARFAVYRISTTLT